MYDTGKKGATWSSISKQATVNDDDDDDPSLALRHAGASVTSLSRWQKVPAFLTKQCKLVQPTIGIEQCDWARFTSRRNKHCESHNIHSATSSMLPYIDWAQYTYQTTNVTL